MPIQTFTAFVHGDPAYNRIDRLVNELHRRANMAFGVNKSALHHTRVKMWRWCIGQRTARLVELRKEWDAKHA